MAAAFTIVVLRQGTRVAEVPVNRVVVRVGADANSDIVLEGLDLPPTALTINFSDPQKILCYSRTPQVSSIAGTAAPLNQGVPLPLQAEVVLSNGVTLIVEARKTEPLSTTVATAAAALRSQPVEPSATQRQVSSRKDQIPSLPTSATANASKRRSSALPLVLAFSLLGLAAIGGLAWSKGGLSEALPTKSSSGQSRLTYATIANQLFELPAQQLAQDSELETIRNHLQLAQKYRNSTVTSRQHLMNARDLLRERLGNDAIAVEPLPVTLQPQFDRISEQQLYQAICELL